MIKKVLTLALACLVFHVQAGARTLDGAQATKDAQTNAEARAKLDRVGTGEKARVTVWLKGGAKRKGYVSERRETEFVLRDRETDAPSVIAYNDVARVEVNHGHSTARNVALAIGVGVGAAFLTVALIIASIND
jgi:hypothetical protein